MRDSCANFTSAASSSKDRSFTIAFSASARYIAPLSRFTYPSLRASREAIVLLPAPAGPSMAMISLRGDDSSFDCSFIVEAKLVHGSAPTHVGPGLRPGHAERSSATH